MNMFNVLLNGVNYFFLLDGKVKNVRFYINKIVNANDMDSAKDKAVYTIKNEIDNMSIDSVISNNDYTLLVEDIVDLDGQDHEFSSSGYSYYEM